MKLLRPEEIERIEDQYESGIPARAIVDVFASKGIRLSEATFRKYVQAGLLPRSRRVGQKGKHRGSQGLYPVEAVRRINAIKKMMAEGMTLENIRQSFVVFQNHIDVAGRELVSVLDAFEGQIGVRKFGDRHKRELWSELKALREQAHDLLYQVARFGSSVTAHAGSDMQVDA
mgnify:CR=1 FL=1